MMGGKNVACRIFLDQIELIRELPIEERGAVLWGAIEGSLNQFENQNENQFDNQNENQNDYALMSVSVSDNNNDKVSSIGRKVIGLLSKNIVWREFNVNYGGRRAGSGRKRGVVGSPVVVKEASKVGKVSEYTALFEEFWEAYPRQRRGSKEKGYKAYLKAVKRGNSEDAILAKTKAYSVSDEVLSGYAKGCEAWLNSDGFLNDYSIKPGKKSGVGVDYNREGGCYDIKPKRFE